MITPGWRFSSRGSMLAQPKAVRRVVVMEGVFIGVTSCVVAVLPAGAAPGRRCNVMLPMDFAKKGLAGERRQRASRPRRICRAGLCRRSASRLRPRLVGGAARSSATFDVTGGGRRSRLSVECDDDLAVAAALLNVGQRLEGLVKWECRVDDWAEVAGVVKGGQLAQLGAVGLHEQERVAHT
jgi:hypothetical protein